jgi:hypothetical protein
MRRSLDDDEDQGAEVPTAVCDPDGVPAACPIGQSTAGTNGHSRIAHYLGPPADRQADPPRKPTFQAGGRAVQRYDAPGAP